MQGAHCPEHKLRTAPGDGTAEVSMIESDIAVVLVATICSLWVMESEVYRLALWPKSNT